MPLRWFVPILLVLVNLCSSGLAWSPLGTFAVNRSEVTFTDISRCLLKYCKKELEFQIKFSRQVAVDVYTPLNVSRPCPLVVFAYSDPDTVVDLANQTASSGYMVATVAEYDLNRPWAFAEDLLFVVHQMQQENKTWVSPYYGMMAGNLTCIMGQGLGAEATILASMDKLERYRELVQQPVIIAMAPRLSESSGLYHAATASMTAALVFASQTDCYYPTEANAVPVYNTINNVDPCKTYVEVLGGNSCFFADTFASLCYGLEQECGAQPTITPSSQRQLVLKLIVDWLGFVLEGNELAWQSFENQLLEQNQQTLAFAQSCQKFNSSNSHSISLSLARGE